MSMRPHANGSVDVPSMFCLSGNCLIFIVILETLIIYARFGAFNRPANDVMYAVLNEEENRHLCPPY
jgi:hypothetical protein